MDIINNNILLIGLIIYFYLLEYKTNSIEFIDNVFMRTIIIFVILLLFLNNNKQLSVIITFLYILSIQIINKNKIKKNLHFIQFNNF